MGDGDPLGRLHAVPGLTGEKRAAITGGTAAPATRPAVRIPPDRPAHSWQESPMTTPHPVGTAVADARTIEVSDDVYTYIKPNGGWFFNNIGFLVGHRGLHRHRHPVDPGAGRRRS